MHRMSNSSHNHIFPCMSSPPYFSPWVQNLARVWLWDISSADSLPGAPSSSPGFGLKASENYGSRVILGCMIRDVESCPYIRVSVPFPGLCGQPAAESRLLVVLGVHILCQSLICSSNFCLLTTSKPSSRLELYRVKAPLSKGVHFQHADLWVGNNSHKDHFIHSFSRYSP